MENKCQCFLWLFYLDTEYFHSFNEDFLSLDSLPYNTKLALTKQIIYNGRQYVELHFWQITIL